MTIFNRKSSQKLDPNNNTTAEDKQKWSRRPANTAFKQQRLKAWQPILTPKTVLPIFFLIGVIFAPIGGILLWGSNKVTEFTIDYTDCDTAAPRVQAGGDTNNGFQALPASKYTYHISSSNGTAPAPPAWLFVNNQADANISRQSLCRLQFQLPVPLDPPVFMYYKLTNYYQNHRRYVKSLSTGQFKGKIVSIDTLDRDDQCKPVARSPSNPNMPIYPCGLIANSLFNDTFLSPVLLNPPNSNSNGLVYQMSEKGIAWGGEASKYKKTQYTNSQVAPPPFWINRYPNGYTDENPIPDLSQDEHFQVWMRTAGLPTFRKLYFRQDTDRMLAGTYVIDIYMNYPVSQFGGTKSIVFSTVSFIGGRNPFLGIAYIVVGALCFLIGALLTIRHLIKPRRLGDMKHLSWNTPKQK
ncbi:uncharacterized protein MELLADRAFT_50780 [Melampsora larici-populina 98AG31]|uniref:Cell cycle control protein n=1 Tax=Melampsora larici-populina (strain 98AG31 / pathotype 3-4-7) TaxID=747676 RepID=F4S8F6_MELLP|nr:uncharacterized protein MELLADRAFT_50780 [Melampsora larici-populina 98AG31]EGF99098.1 hypothetical protein MELLADRAFT_50780 [Melampsora larici-populina 98AG31]